MVNDNGNVLYNLAQVMAVQEQHLTATALRRLAQTGYTCLAEVDQVSDWELLAIPGIGPGRLEAIRRLTRPEWRPPSKQAIRTGERFLSAAQLALRFWKVEDLESAVQGTRPTAAEGTTAEGRLTIEAFASAAREALHHHAPEEMIQIVHRAKVLISHNRKAWRAG